MSAPPDTNTQGGLGGSLFFDFDSYRRAECMAFLMNFIGSCMVARPDTYWITRALEHCAHAPCEWEVKAWASQARVWGKAAYLHAIDHPARPEDIEWLR